MACTMASIKDQAHEKGVAAKTTVMNIVGDLKTKTLGVHDATQIRVSKAIGYTKTKASELGAKLRENKVTAGSTVALGAAGGAAGTVTGGVAGAAVGVPAALFTFGLSIPFCAAVGGGVGFCTGAVMGGSAGAAAGTAFTRREEIKDRACGVWSKVQGGVMHAKGKAQDHALAVKERP